MYNIRHISCILFFSSQQNGQTGISIYIFRHEAQRHEEVFSKSSN